MFVESSIEEKLRVFFNLCDYEKKGSISKDQFYEMLNKNMIFSEQKMELKRISKNENLNLIVNKIFSSVELNSNGEITLYALLI